MFLPLQLQLAFQSLKRHKLRTALTVLGIIIGISAVIIVMSAGESLKGYVLGELEAFGSDYIQIEIKVPTKARNSAANAGSIAAGIEVTTLTLDDAKEVGKLPNIRNYYAGIIGQGVVSYLDQNKIINFLATTDKFIDIDASEVENGRYFTRDEDNTLARVVVLGSDVADELFGNQNPVDKRIKIGKNKFKVIGVLEERGGGFGFNFDEMIYLPVQTAQKLIMGIDHVMYITAQMQNTDIQYQTADEIVALLREQHDITDPKDDDFSVTTMEEANDMIDTVFGGITLLLVAIAAISLLVGGVGIMNIMYVSVSERTFEIGLRKSVGAKKKQILWQFLWEAVVVTVFGGLIGVVIGIGMTFLISVGASYAGYAWDYNLPPEAILIAFGFSAAVGIIFGYYPAVKAARMDPITALRKE